MGQVGREHLGTGTHDLAHSRFNLANGIVVTATIAIDKHEAQILLLLKEVAHAERRLEVRVQIVFDLLGFAHLMPTSIALLEDQTLGIRLAECVQILKLPPRDEEVYGHAQIVGSCVHHRDCVLFFL